MMFYKNKFLLPIPLLPFPNIITFHHLLYTSRNIHSKRTTPSWLIFHSVAATSLLIPLFLFLFFWMYDMIAKLLQDNTRNSAAFIFNIVYHSISSFVLLIIWLRVINKELGLLRLYRYWLEPFFVITCWLISK